MISPDYSALKAAWHQDKIAALRRGEQIVPAQIQLVISDLCNHDCAFCAYRMSGYESNQNFGEMTAHGFTNNPNRKIATGKALEILNDAALLGVGGIQFTGGGEPTVHPDHLQIFGHAQRLGLKTALVTNGARFVDGWERVLPRMAWVRVSLDAGTPDTYAAIRRVKPRIMGRVLSNLALLRMEIEKQATGCVLGASFVVTRENYRECSEAVALVAHQGVKSIRFAAVFTPDGADYYDGFRDEALASVREAVAAAPKGFTAIDMLTPRIDDLSRGAPRHAFCGYQQFNTYIGGDLKVYRCCNLAYNDRGAVGDLSEQSLLSWFHSLEKRTNYREFDARGCRSCAFHRQNEAIHYLTSEPAHVEFV